MRTLTVDIDSTECRYILAPKGITTPYDAVADMAVIGGQITQALKEEELGLSALMIEPTGSKITIRYQIDGTPTGASYPDAAFEPRRNQFTVAADDLAVASRDIVEEAGGGRSGIEALVAETESRFSYAHPEHRFDDGSDAVPYLSCGKTPGSCVDINTYLVASLRAAGYEAAYFYGYFFPEERGGVTYDGHCWVATRHEGEILEWDIAHHIKANLGPTKAGLNPRPGVRVGISHSMGHNYGFADDKPLLKILGEPIGLSETMEPIDPKITARLEPFVSASKSG